jgi:hypothetical protein
MKQQQQQKKDVLYLLQDLKRFASQRDVGVTEQQRRCTMYSSSINTKDFKQLESYLKPRKLIKPWQLDI